MFVSWKTALSIRCSIQIPRQAGLHAGYFGFCPQPHLNPAARIVFAEADPSLLDCGSQPYNLAVQFKRLVVALGALPQKALRAFTEKTETWDSPAGTNRIQGLCWSGGQHGWRNRIRRICVGALLVRGKMALPSRKLRSNLERVSALSCASVGCTVKRAALVRPNSAGTRDMLWPRTRNWSGNWWRSSRISRWQRSRPF